MTRGFNCVKTENVVAIMKSYPEILHLTQDIHATFGNSQEYLPTTTHTKNILHMETNLDNEPTSNLYQANAYEI